VPLLSTGLHETPENIPMTADKKLKSSIRPEGKPKKNVRVLFFDDQKPEGSEESKGNMAIAQIKPLEKFSCPIPNEQMAELNDNSIIGKADLVAQTIVKNSSSQQLYQILHVALPEEKIHAATTLAYEIVSLEKNPSDIAQIAASNRDLRVLALLITCDAVPQSVIEKIQQVADTLGYAPEFKSILQACKSQEHEKDTFSP